MLQKLFRLFSPEDASVFFLGIIFLGFFTDRAILSLGMIALVIHNLLRSHWPNAWKQFLQRPDLIALTLIFAIYLTTGLYSENFSLLLERLRIKLPFLLLPFAFALLKPYNNKQFTLILYVYFSLISLASLGVLINYLIFFEEITSSFIYGKAIPTPYSHIRFSLFVAFAFFTGLELYRKKVILKFKWERKVIIIATVFLFIFSHVLAVRSGLLALYLALFFWIIHYLITTRKVIIGWILMILLITVPWIAYKMIPTLNNKINYMLYDLKMRSSGTSQEYSDTGRLISIKVGWELVKDNLWFGVGSGDVRNEVIDYYKKHYPHIESDHNRKSPHNQFITVWLANGIFGLAAFVVCLFYPLFYNRNYKFVLFSCFYIILLSSLMTENTLEIQLGIGFYLALLLPMLNFLNRK